MNEDEEKRLLEGYRKLSPRSRYIALAQIIAGAEMEESARRIGQEVAARPDMPLFNGTGPEVQPSRARHGSAEPVLA
jgi:hypothetical protein